MLGTSEGRPVLALVALASALVASACSMLVPSSTPGVGHETMPGPASVWLTAEPSAPEVPVPVVMTSLDDPMIHFAHTFAAGEVLRGSLATSQGRYRLAGLDGACSVVLPLGPGQAADVVLRLEGEGRCTLAVVRQGSMDDPAMQHDEPAVLITNGGGGQPSGS
jgi:hypothetical protein